MSTTRDDGPRLLSLAVHEFRTPVTVVAGYLRMVLKMPTAGLGEQPRKLLEEAEKSCARLAALISELSELSNTQAGHLPVAKSTFDLGALVAEVAATVHEGEGRDVRLEVLPSERRIVIEGDRPRLGQALASLVTATLRERGEPGIIAVRFGNVVVDGRCLAYVVVAPRDECGVAGFSRDEWGPFDLWRGGLGFRVVLASEVIDAHGGTLFSGRDRLARAACALTLPAKEPSC